MPHVRHSKKILRNLKFVAGFIAIIVVTFLVLAGPSRISNIFNRNEKKADYYFLNPPSTINVGGEFTADLHVSSNGNAINAVGVILSFNPEMFAITNMITEQSFCSFYADNAFDNIKGEVHISCGAPSPGFSGDSDIAQIKFRSRTVGTSDIRLLPTSQILANDGKGTNLIHTFPSFTISSKQLL